MSLICQRYLPRLNLCLPSLRVLYRCPVENETAVGLLNRLGLFSRGAFRSFIDNGTEAIEYLGDRRTTNMVAQCPPRHFLDSEFPFAQLRLLCCVDSHFVSSPRARFHRSITAPS